MARADDVMQEIAKELKAITLAECDLADRWISTGVRSIDSLLGGGVPCGLISEFVGDFSTGKSLLGLQICREAIAAGGLGVYGDAENALHRPWATGTLGVDAERLIYPEIFTLEQGYDHVERTLDVVQKRGLFPAVFVWDTIAAPPPKVMREGDGSTMGARARVNSERLPKILADVRKSGMALVLINQLRSKIGVQFGRKWESCGGRAIRFYSSLRVLLARTGKQKFGKVVIGTKGYAEVLKSRLSRPYRFARFEIDFERGVPPWAGTLDLLKRAGVLHASGGVYHFKATTGKWRGEAWTFAAEELPGKYKRLWRQTSKALIQKALDRGESKDGE